jgi:diguanylate cyclase (GGDEF)-like protein
VESPEPHPSAPPSDGRSSRWIGALELPSEMTPFEVRYRERLNRIGCAFLALHVPIVGALGGATGLGLGPLGAAALVAALPWALGRAGVSPRRVSVALAVSAILMCAVLVQAGRGPVQGELHASFFAVLALVAVFASPAAVLAAAATIAVHHGIAVTFFPGSAFPADVPVEALLVRLLFVWLESAGVAFVARTFFDRVVDLERVVASRTHALERRTQETQLLLDHVRDGFVMIDAHAHPVSDHSAILEHWLGAPEDGETVFDWLGRSAPAFGAAGTLAWEEVRGAIMPREVAIEQLPHQLDTRGRIVELDYVPIGDAEPPARTLVVMRDVTEQRARARAEEERAEALVVFERAGADVEGFRVFFDGASALVRAVERAQTPTAEVRHALHTIKGNASVYGLGSIARLCHRLEEYVVTAGEAPPPSLVRELGRRWSRVARDVDRWMDRRRDTVTLAHQDLDAVEAALAQGGRPEDAAALIRRLRLQPVRVKLERFGEQASGIAERLGKKLHVEVVGHDVRLDPLVWSDFWSGFVHAVRNAVDHGIELPEERVAGRKPEAGRLVLRVSESARAVVVEVQDDGRGIDWEAVRAKALRAGMPAASRDDLVRCLFSEGFSTAPCITDLSGRGVGTSALLAATEALGGSIEIDSLLRGPLGSRDRFWAERAGASAYVQIGRMGELVRALASAIAAAPAPEGFFTELNGEHVDVRDRLAAHLDAALFESVVAAEVRALSVAGELERLFDLFAQLCTRLTSYRWLALDSPSTRRTLLHAHPSSRAVAEHESRAAFALDDDRAITLVEDEDPSDEAHGPAPLTVDVPFGAEVIARLALAPRGGGDAADRRLVDIMARELGGPVRMALLVEESHRLATIDPLTGLMNRRAFGPAFTREIVRVERTQAPLSVLVLDIDHFKSINDGHGHAMGDVVLSHVGRALAATARKVDLCARWGGEEFIVVLPDATSEGAAIAAERIRRALHALGLRHEGRTLVPVTASIGVAQWRAGDTVETLVERADAAMYAAKREGRDRVVVACAAERPSEASWIADAPPRATAA